MARIKRTAKGTSAKGVSGNRGGRPKLNTDLRDLAREHTTGAIEALVTIMRHKHAPAATRVSAAVAMLDRGHGKPMQTLEHDIPVLEKDSHIDLLVAARQIAVVLSMGDKRLANRLSK